MENYQLTMLNTEISKAAYDGMTNEQIRDTLNATQTITNEATQQTVDIYNATNSCNPKIFITDFINLITTAELIAAKSDPAGLILYERLFALEIVGKYIDVTDPLVVYGVAAAVTDGWLTSGTAEALTGSGEQLDPEYKETFQVESIAFQMFYRPVTTVEVTVAKGV